MQLTNNSLKQAQNSDSSRWIALVVLCAGMLMIVLDSTIVNVALPSIQDDLGFSQSSLAWVVNAYLIAFGGLLLLAGRLGDLIGRRTIFLTGLGLFTAASLACGLADSETALVAARFVQGIGGALTSAVILGMIVTMFPEPSEQAKAIGVYAFVASAGGSIGLLAGGAITQVINWHWIFFVNLPIAAITAAFALRVLERDRGLGFDQGADLPGAALIVSSLMLGVYTIVETSSHGWGSLHTLGFGAVAIALFAGFVARQATARTPLMPLRMFRSRNLSGANVIQSLMVAGMFGMFFLGALYLQRVLGFDSLEIGFAFLPLTVLLGLFSVGLSARLNLRFGPRATMIPGLLLIGVGLLSLSRLTVDSSYFADVLPAMVLIGTGAGLCFPSVMTLAMSSVAPEEAGLASGVVNTTLQVGGALGLAVLATLASSRTGNAVAAGDGAAAALTSGYRLAFLIAAGMVAIAIAVAVFVLEPASARTRGAEEAYAPGDDVPEPVFSSEAF
jgi:EmrB/QacA subfamily drug resistance transporter